jgi:hypothetical protein
MHTAATYSGAHTDEEIEFTVIMTFDSINCVRSRLAGVPHLR